MAGNEPRHVLRDVMFGEEGEEAWYADAGAEEACRVVGKGVLRRVARSKIAADCIKVDRQGDAEATFRFGHRQGLGYKGCPCNNGGQWSGSSG